MHLLPDQDRPSDPNDWRWWLRNAGARAGGHGGAAALAHAPAAAEPPEQPVEAGAPPPEAIRLEITLSDPVGSAAACRRAVSYLESAVVNQRPGTQGRAAGALRETATSLRHLADALHPSGAGRPVSPGGGAPA